MNPKTLIKITQNAGAAWLEHDAPTMGAALSYYAVFSVAPLLLISIAISAFVFGEEAARGQIVEQIGGLVGKEGGAAIQTMIEHANKPGAGLLATLMGIVALVFGASGVFGQLQDSLNKIWGVTQKPGQAWITLLRHRFVSFAMTLGVGFLLLISLVLSAWLASLGHFVEGVLPPSAIVGRVMNLLLSFGVITVLFALIFKVLPDAQISWSDVWIGAVITALLFNLGKHLIGLYLGTSAVASAYGAAGSLVVVLLWVYYSAQILFFGAEITKAYATMAGSYCWDESQIQPSRGAESVKLVEKPTAHGPQK